jgi:hypothetical protein
LDNRNEYSGELGDWLEVLSRGRDDG